MRVCALPCGAAPAPAIMLRAHVRPALRRRARPGHHAACACAPCLAVPRPPRPPCCAVSMCRILEGLGTAPGATSLVPKYGPCEDDGLKEVRHTPTYPQTYPMRLQPVPARTCAAPPVGAAACHHCRVHTRPDAASVLPIVQECVTACTGCRALAAGPASATWHTRPGSLAPVLAGWQGSSGWHLGVCPSPSLGCLAAWHTRPGAPGPGWLNGELALSGT